MAVPLKDAEDDRFAKSAPASFALDAFGTEERFVNFNLSRKGRLGVTVVDEAQPDRLLNIG